MKLSITVLLLAANLLLFAQPNISWIKEFDTSSEDECSFSLTETNDNNGYIICGYRNTPGTLQDLILIRTNTFGDTIWIKEYGKANGSDYGIQIVKNGNGYLIGGMLSNPANHFYDAWLLRINENGDSLWSKAYLDSARIMAICSTPDGNFAITGARYINNQSKTFIAKIDINGNQLWLNYYGGNYNNYSWDMVCTKDSGLAVIGSIDTSSSTTNRAWLIKTNSSGVEEFETVYDMYCVRGKIHETNNGDLLVGIDNMGSACFLKLNSSGQFLDSLNYSGYNADYATPEITQSADSNYICVYTDLIGSPDYSSIYCKKYDQNFNTIWTKVISGNRYYANYGFLISSENSVLITGWSAEIPNGINRDILLVKLEGDIVPVELVSFSGTIANYEVTLNWKTATETNNYGFDIERSSDKMNWKKIGFVKGNVTSSDPHSYSFIDSTLQSGTVYYRLKQIDLNGFFTYSNEIRIDFNPIVFTLEQNYPNPFNPVTTIKYSIPENENVSLVVYNILGQKVVTLTNEVKSSGNYFIRFDGSNLSSGIYIYQLTWGTHSITKKMLLLK